MNVGRVLALVFTLAVALSALSGSTNLAAAQGAVTDVPSGHAMSPVVDDLDAGTLFPFARGLRLIRTGHSPLLPAYVAWAPSRRTPVASDRIAVVPTGRRTIPAPAQRQRAVPAGR